MKPTFRIPKGHHLIRKTDVRYKIISGNVKMDSYSLQQFFNDSKKPDVYVFVRKIKGIPIAIIELTFHQTKVEGIEDVKTFYQYSLIVELLAVDKKYQGLGIGTQMMALAENVGLSLNVYKISLDAVEDEVDFYKKLGYSQTGKSYNDPDWGKLVPMERKL